MSRGRPNVSAWPPGACRMISQRTLLRLLLGLNLAGAAGWFALHRERFDPPLIEGLIRELGLWALLAHVTSFAGTVLFLPGAVICGLAGGGLFGPLWGTIITLVGATLGATSSFLVARYLAAEWISRRAQGPSQRLMARVE